MTDIQDVANELAASASDPITAVGLDGKFSLRQAVAGIFWKTQSIIGLKNRPVNPARADDQFGHVMSARVEGLVTQQLLIEFFTVNKNLGVDPVAVRQEVLDNL